MGTTDKAKLKMLMAYFDENQKQFSQRLHVSLYTMRSWLQRDNITPFCAQKILNNIPEVNPKWLFEDEEPMCFDRNHRPYYRDVNASCGHGNDAVADETDIGVVHTNVAGVDAFINAEGDSMSPKIEDGDILGIAKLGPFEQPNTRDIYLFITYDGDRYVKKLEEVDPESDTITLLSINELYKPFSVIKQDIVRIYKVVSIGKKA